MMFGNMFQEKIKGRLDTILRCQLNFPDERRGMCWQILSDPNAKMNQKLAAVTSLVVDYLPVETVRRWQNLLNKKDLNSLPFLETMFIHKLQFAEGTRKDVHLMEELDGRKNLYVVKIMYCDRDSTVKDVVRIASDMRKGRKFLEEYYDIEDLFLPEDLLICRASNDGRLAILLVQKYIKRMTDIFDYSIEELLDILRHDNKLNKTFLKFYRKTKEFAREGVVVDLLGKKNLVLAEMEDGRKRLLFIDAEVYSSWKSLMRNYEDIYCIIKERFKFLGDVAKQLPKKQ